MIIGTNAYRSFFDTHRVPSVVAGFEPIDILQGVLRLVEMIEADAPALENCYPRAVLPDGNIKAQQIMDTVFEVCDATWRGIGRIPASGMRLRKEFEVHDAVKRFNITLVDTPPPKGCRCGEILTGRLTPPECPLYKKACTPLDPVGPCMVSSEGTCAAFYKYHG